MITLSLNLEKRKKRQKQFSMMTLSLNNLVAKILTIWGRKQLNVNFLLNFSFCFQIWTQVSNTLPAKRGIDRNGKIIWKQYEHIHSLFIHMLMNGDGKSSYELAFGGGRMKNWGHENHLSHLRCHFGNGILFHERIRSYKQKRTSLYIIFHLDLVTKDTKDVTKDTKGRNFSISSY